MRFRNFLACLALLSLVNASCNKQGEEPASVKSDPQALLDAAIQARGGLAKLKAASSWTGNWTGISKGMVHTGTQVFKDGQIRRDFKMPNGQEVTVVRGRDGCWTTMGDKLFPCAAAEQRFSRQGVALNQASSLWPLKEGDWKLAVRSMRVGEQDYDGLTAKSAELEASIVLIFNKQTHLASRIILHGVTLNDKTGDVVAEILDHKKFCDVIFYTKSLVDFAGERIASNDLSQISCGPVDDKLFVQPAGDAAEEPAEKPAEKTKTPTPKE